VLGQTAARHTSDESVGSLATIVDAQPPADSHHSRQSFDAEDGEGSAFLAAHPNVRLHFMAAYSPPVESSRALVCHGRPQRAGTRRLHLGRRSERDIVRYIGPIQRREVDLWSYSGVQVTTASDWPLQLRLHN
jgi:hypothetical protein